MKKIRIIGNIIFFLSILSLIFSFSLAAIVGEADIFGVAGIVRYSWIMWLFIPISVLSLIIGKYLKVNNEKYKKNHIIAFICIPILLIFGSYRFIFTLSGSVSFDIKDISVVEEITDLQLPNNAKVATCNFEQYSVSYIKTNLKDEKAQFENEVNNSELWNSFLDSRIENLLPLSIQMEIKDFDYFVFYNSLTGEYNTFPNGQCDCIFVAYDCDTQRMLLLNDYSIKDTGLSI